MFLSNINEGRGVAIYTKKSLNADAVKVESPFKESVWCKIQLQNHDSLIPSVLDLIFSNEENMVEKVNFLSSLGKSDHLVLTFNLVCYTIPDFKSE